MSTARQAYRQLPPDPSDRDQHQTWSHPRPGIWLVAYVLFHIPLLPLTSAKLGNKTHCSQKSSPLARIRAQSSATLPTPTTATVSDDAKAAQNSFDMCAKSGCPLYLARETLQSTPAADVKKKVVDKPMLKNHASVLYGLPVDKGRRVGATGNMHMVTGKSRNKETNAEPNDGTFNMSTYL